MRWVSVLYHYILRLRCYFVIVVAIRICLPDFGIRLPCNSRIFHEPLSHPSGRKAVLYMTGTPLFQAAFEDV